MKCLQCHKSFKNEKSLHSHLRVHGGAGQYYQTFYPRFDLYDNTIIEFKTKEQYFSSFFNSIENRNRFYEKEFSSERARRAFKKELLLNLKKKNCAFIPSHNYLKLAGLTGVCLIKKMFGSVKNFCDKENVTPLFEKNLPKEFWNKSDMSDMRIFVDTREQKPFIYKDFIFNKLDVGDYVGAGAFYKKVFVDRKTVGDFLSTFGSGNERFKEELKRTSLLNSYLFVIVEGTVEDIIEYARSSSFKRKPNLDYAFHNTRSFLIEYASYFQIVFCKNREQAKEITQRILYFAEIAKQCDLQYELDKRTAA